MKEKICVKGSAVVLLRKRHPRLSRQKSLAHALGVSVRTLRKVETTNDPWDKSFAMQIADCLGCALDAIVFSAVGPKLVPPPAPITQPQIVDNRIRGMQLYPRYDKESASQVTDAENFFRSANRANRVLVQYQMKLPPDLAANVDELIELGRTASEERNPYPYLMDEDDPRVPDIKARMQYLLTWLKGSDVHVFVCDHTKFLPELDEAPPDRSWDTHEWHAVIAIAPPQEWGETSFDVDVDHGRPYFINWDIPPLFSAPGNS